jgi:hypothetical protein
MISRRIPKILERKMNGSLIKIELTDRPYDSGSINIIYLNKNWKPTLRDLSRKIVEKGEQFRVEGIDLTSDDAIEKIKENIFREYDGKIMEHYVLKDIECLLKYYK